MDIQKELQLTGGNNKGTRRDLDFYPTPKECTVALMDFLKLDTNIVIWEPACGDGAMTRVLESYGHKVISTDIQYGQDFFMIDNTYDAIITNPPFNLSEEFIKKSLENATIVCMLLKSQYWHASKRYELFNNTNPEYVLPLTWRPDFLEHTRKEGDKKGSPTMEVAWTVWNKKYEGETKYLPLKKPLSK